MRSFIAPVLLLCIPAIAAMAIPQGMYPVLFFPTPTPSPYPEPASNYTPEPVLIPDPAPPYKANPPPVPVQPTPNYTPDPVPIPDPAPPNNLNPPPVSVQPAPPPLYPQPDPSPPSLPGPLQPAPPPLYPQPDPTSPADVQPGPQVGAPCQDGDENGNGILQILNGALKCVLTGPTLNNDLNNLNIGILTRETTGTEFNA